MEIVVYKNSYDIRVYKNKIFHRARVLRISLVLFTVKPWANEDES